MRQRKESIDKAYQEKMKAKFDKKLNKIESIQEANHFRAHDSHYNSAQTSHKKSASKIKVYQKHPSLSHSESEGS